MPPRPRGAGGARAPSRREQRVLRWTGGGVPVTGGCLSRSLGDLEAFMKAARTGLKTPVKEGDYDGLVEVMGHLMKVKERQVATDNMFEPLKQTIELLRTYGEEMPEEIYVKLQVDGGRGLGVWGREGDGGRGLGVWGRAGSQEPGRGQRRAVDWSDLLWGKEPQARAMLYGWRGCGPRAEAWACVWLVPGALGLQSGWGVARSGGINGLEVGRSGQNPLVHRRR